MGVHEKTIYMGEFPKKEELRAGEGEGGLKKKGGGVFEAG